VLPLLLAERYGGGLSQYLNMGADEREYYLNILSVEAEVDALYAELEPGDEVVFVEDMYNLPPQD
jgi:hypothetical protein